MWGELLLPLCGASLALALLIAVYADIRWRIIPDQINLAIMLTAPIAWWAQGLSLNPDIAWQLAAGGGLFLFYLLQFRFNLIGGGDVKLLGALGLWIAPAHIIEFILGYTLIGGGISLIMLVMLKIKGQPAFTGSLNFRLPDDDDDDANQQLADRFSPYGLSIAIAGWWVIYQQYFNHFPALSGN